MLAFLGIVSDEDLARGITEPSFILCATNRNTNEGRTGWRVYAANKMPAGVRKLLISSWEASGLLEEFLSFYRTRVHAKGRRRVKYRPHGALFWFPCDDFGNRVKEPPLYVRHVPVYGTSGTSDRGADVKRRFDTLFSSLLAKLAGHKDAIPLQTTDVKRMYPA